MADRSALSKIIATTNGTNMRVASLPKRKQFSIRRDRRSAYYLDREGAIELRDMLNSFLLESAGEINVGHSEDDV